MRSLGAHRTPIAFLYGVLHLLEGDRKTGLAWIGHARAHEPNRQEIAMMIRSFGKLVRGADSEEAVEAGMSAGEGMKLEEILGQAEKEG